MEMLGEHDSTVEHIPSSTFPQPISLQRDRALWTELMKRIAQGDESALGEHGKRAMRYSPFCHAHVLRVRSAGQPQRVTLRDEPSDSRPAGSSKRFPALLDGLFDHSPQLLASMVVSRLRTMDEKYSTGP